MGTSNISLSLITMPRTWAVDMTPDSADSFRRVELASPPGYSKQDANDQDSKVATKRADQTQLKIKKAKELAWQPAKSFMMTGFMLWMSGNGVHIFSIMITFYAIYNPIKSAFGVNSVFAKFSDANMNQVDKATLLTSKVTFVALNMVAMSGALYKMSLMGLLPTTPADWVAFLDVPPATQFSTGTTTLQ